MVSILDKIIAEKKNTLINLKNKYSSSSILEKIKKNKNSLNFMEKINKNNKLNIISVIAEIKKASPSAGIIIKNYNPVKIADEYYSNGATALSILTEEKFFFGNLEHIKLVKEKIKLPVLCKDFMIDIYQVHEAKVIGADCILIIISALSDMQAQEIVGVANEIGLDILVEVHDREELERGMMLRTPLIGINNRNLHTFETSLDTTLNLLTDVFQDRTIVTESGIHSREDIELMQKNNVNAFLIGEAFMKTEDPGEELKRLFFN